MLGFGGGYAMLSMIMADARKFSITAAQFADMNALDMVVPGAIAINSATYVGYLHSGFTGAVVATLGVSIPSFIITALMMRLFKRFENNNWLTDILSGIKPMAVGLICATVYQIGAEVLFNEGKSFSYLFSDPLGAVSVVGVIIFVVSAVANIKFKVNPILITIIAGAVGAVFLK